MVLVYFFFRLSPRRSVRTTSTNTFHSAGELKSDFLLLPLPLFLAPLSFHLTLPPSLPSPPPLRLLLA